MTTTRLTSSPDNRGGASAPPARGVRAVRLALPRAIAELTPEDEPALAGVNAFVDQLVDLPASEWEAVGRAVAADHAALLVRRAAWTAIDGAITDHGLGMTAWYVRDAVDTAAFLASRGVSRWSPDGRRMFAAAHGAAEVAALALLARTRLGADTLSVACAPFETLLETTPNGSGATAPRALCPQTTADRAVPHTRTSAE